MMLGKVTHNNVSVVAVNSLFLVAHIVFESRDA